MRMNSARLARRWQEAGGDFARMAEALNEEIENEIATKVDLQATEARLETKIEGVRADLIKWIGGMMVLQVIAVVGLVRLLFVP
jgi:hypothetical protein